MVNMEKSYTEWNAELSRLLTQEFRYLKKMESSHGVERTAVKEEDSRDMSVEFKNIALDDSTLRRMLAPMHKRDLYSNVFVTKQSGVGFSSTKFSWEQHRKSSRITVYSWTPRGKQTLRDYTFI